jgi:BlaI family transcriptional regulator, penicillinase repressor
MTSDTWSQVSPITPIPTDVELEILSVLWKQGPSTVREVHNALGHRRVYTTILKQMQIMKDKRLLTRNDSSRSHVYSAGIGRWEAQAQIISDILKRLFDGSTGDLVSAALKLRLLSMQEWAQINEEVTRIQPRS